MHQHGGTTAYGHLRTLRGEPPRMLSVPQLTSSVKAGLLKHVIRSFAHVQQLRTEDWIIATKVRELELGHHFSPLCHYFRSTAFPAREYSTH